MNILKENELKTLEQICSLSQGALKKTLSTFLHSKYPKEKIFETPEFLCAEGDIPIALVAHMDTVFKTPPKDIFYDMRKNVLWSPDGLGADDRAGVFAILQILKSGLKPHIVFTTDEEVGGYGAMMLAEIYPNSPFKDLRYMIELDRRGSNDCVFYECDNEDFTKYIESFGFIEAWGTFSDICELSPVWKVASTNLSIGYQNEHSVSETLRVNAMLATIEKVKKMLQVPVDEIPFFNFIPMPYPYRALNRFYGGWDWYDGYDSAAYGYSDFSGKKTGKTKTKTYQPKDNDDVEYCMICGKTYYAEDMMPVVSEDGLMEYYCTDCVCSVPTDWCTDCETLFVKSDSNQIKCAICEKEDLALHGSGANEKD